jgi:predicted dienelactone hydrolase
VGFYDAKSLRLALVTLFFRCRKTSFVVILSLMETLSLIDNGTTFLITLLKAAKPVCIVLFSAGSGGNPERHIGVMKSLAENNCTVVAPHFDRLASPNPTEDELLTRARRLGIALDSVANPNFPVAGVGHSIGATILLAMSGGQIWLGVGQQVNIKPDERIGRLVLMAPPIGFFKAPGALKNVHTPMQVWVGTDDQITPPTQSEFLKRTIGDQAPVDLQIVDGAGHFSFMNTLPPQTVDPLPNRETFLSDLATEIRRFIAE